MNIRIATFICVSILTYSCSTTQKEQPSVKQPNIIFIISDDQSYGDYGFMGHESIETPHIDQLAKESMTFTRGYVTAPLCSPSLASIITGQYAFRHGITGNDPVVSYEGPKWYKLETPSDTFPDNSYPIQRDKAYEKLAANYYKNRLITQTLSEKGYRSFQSGKWWVGSAEDAGFDKGMTHGDFTRGGRHGDEGLKIGREGLEPIYDFIKESETLGKPFFVWYAPFLPHTPHNPPKELEEKYMQIAPNPYVARYWAMVEWFDKTTGDLLNHLKEKGLDENTIIVYTSDNGWIQSDNSKRYAPKSKRSPYEGGIRTPIMFKYPGTIEPELNQNNIVSNIDILPTVYSLLGMDKRDLPGIDVLNINELENRNTIFAEAYNHDIINIEEPSASILYKVALDDNWKLILPNNETIVENASSEKENIAGYYSNQAQLFNLKSDPLETNNVAKSNPDQVQRLEIAINDWWNPK